MLGANLLLIIINSRLLLIIVNAYLYSTCVAPATMVLPTDNAVCIGDPQILRNNSIVVRLQIWSITKSSKSGTI